jgi:hypothetical protein
MESIGTGMREDAREEGGLGHKEPFNKRLANMSASGDAVTKHIKPQSGLNNRNVLSELTIWQLDGQDQGRADSF